MQVAEEIEHRQWIAGGLCSLGALYIDVFAPERARALLERALALAHELGSLVWAPYAAARLAMSHTLNAISPKRPLLTVRSNTSHTAEQLPRVV